MYKLQTLTVCLWVSSKIYLTTTEGGNYAKFKTFFVNLRGS